MISASHIKRTADKYILSDGSVPNTEVETVRTTTNFDEAMRHLGVVLTYYNANQHKDAVLIKNALEYYNRNNSYGNKI